jgi:hypothetical protein
MCRPRDCEHCYVKPRGDSRRNRSGPNARRQHTLCEGDATTFVVAIGRVEVCSVMGWWLLALGLDVAVCQGQ